MRARGMTAKPLRSPRRSTDKAARGDMRRRAGAPAVAPERSTFRRVAVFVPLPSAGSAGPAGRIDE